MLTAKLFVHVWHKVSVEVIVSMFLWPSEVLRTVKLYETWAHTSLIRRPPMFIAAQERGAW